ncbi:MAG: aminotransferase class I/II-fold pyridoxal phosphate-dependent enzyme [Phycisphaerales bacterium]|nr:aminotransferase class I/II-fold pyridoxal phosphate-dependent enzyme [Phycisphaerales bacterium]
MQAAPSIPGPAIEAVIADRLRPFGTTIFAEMTKLAVKHNAVNLAQGFPDFDGPDFIKEAAHAAMRAGQNQYARTTGLPVLSSAIAEQWRARTGLSADPDAEVTVTSGCTEALAATFLGIINPGDEVILFEPFYDSYRACIAMAGATPKFVALRPPPTGTGEFTFDQEELARAVGPRTRAILVNTPHNPTGKVYTRAELQVVADLCLRHNLIAITDEVYEHLVYEPALPHVSLATLAGMAERTITLSSLGKTFSLTGWKIGWAIARPGLTAGVRAAHQFLTFATATPLQAGAAEALKHGSAAIAELAAMFRGNRDYLCSALRELGFAVHIPAGTYFIMADHSAISRRLGMRDDREFCVHLTEKVGVAAIPPSVFYDRAELGRSLARFAFCKKRATLEAAVQRLRKLSA